MSSSGQWSINFIQTSAGASFPYGGILNVSFPGARYIIGGIYKKGNNGPSIILTSKVGAPNQDVQASVRVAATYTNIKGPCTLKVRAYLQDWTNQYIETDFTIV